MRINLFDRPLVPAAVLCITLFCATAHAQMTYIKISAGTGFVINQDGNVVTNAHVLRDCQSINVHTDHGELPATLVASDTEHDLAVLNVPGLNGMPMAPLRWNISDLKIGDPVEILGFPGQAGVEGHYSFKKTSVTSLEGPTKEPRFIQLATVAQHGNSGGPVLDASGNVIAVISGMAQTFRVGPNGQIESEPVGQSDVAITLATLQEFLRYNAIPFYESNSGLVAYADTMIESNALKFTVPIRCMQGKVTQ